MLYIKDVKSYWLNISIYCMEKNHWPDSLMDSSSNMDSKYMMLILCFLRWGEENSRKFEKGQNHKGGAQWRGEIEREGEGGWYHLAEIL